MIIQRSEGIPSFRNVCDGGGGGGGLPSDRTGGRGWGGGELPSERTGGRVGVECKDDQGFVVSSWGVPHQRNTLMVRTFNFVTDNGDRSRL